MLKYPVLLLFALLAAYILQLNAQLYYSPHFEEGAGGAWNTQVLQQLDYLQPRMQQGAARDMQALFPEGFIFSNVLYGLAWCDFAKNIKPNTALHQRAIEQADWACQQVNLPEAKRIFPKNLVSIPYGIYYRAWSNYLLGKKLELQGIQASKPAETAIFQENCKDIARAFDKSTIPFIESYTGMTWPADNVVGLASLALHDRLLAPRYQPTLVAWLHLVKNGYLDPATGLIPHSTNPYTGQVMEGAQGSSQSLMLCFLQDIDPVFAAQQFGLYQQFFLDDLMGLPGIREYPKGFDGPQHIDSGPIIMGMGAAACITGIRALRVQAHPQYAPLRNAVEGLGTPICLFGKKCYFCGLMPMADLFLAWANAADMPPQPRVFGADRWVLHLVSGLVLVGMCFLMRLVK